MSDDVVVLSNNLSTLQQRTSKTGKKRMVVVFKSEPIVADLSPKALGAAVSTAIAETLREKVRGITAAAATATLAYRKRAEKAFSDGKRWAMKRYAGGKIGPMGPNQGKTLFNDSGRLVRGIVAGATKDGWTVNVPVNRLDPTTTGAGGVERMFARLVQLVPEFGNPELLMQSPRIPEAVTRGVAAMFTKMGATVDQISEARARLVSQRNKELLNLLKDAAELLVAG